MQPDPESTPSNKHKANLHRPNLLLGRFVQEAGDLMLQEQREYHRHFNTNERPTRDQLKTGSFVFVRQAHI